jgi:hypothetical protein
MAHYIIGGRTEYFLSNRDGDPVFPGTVSDWLSSVGDPNVSSEADLYEWWGAGDDASFKDTHYPGGRFPTENDNVDPWFALVAVGKTNINGYDVPIWYRTFFVFTQNPETPNARQIVGGKQYFWLPGQTAVVDYSWGTETPDWIGIGVSGDGLKAGSNVGQLFFDEHLGGVGNIVILADPGPGDGGIDDLYDLEVDGRDVPIAPYQLIALSQHDPFGTCWSQTRLYTLPANAKNPNRSGTYGMTWVGWKERVWDTSGGNPTVTNKWGSSSTEVSHSFTGQWWQPQSKWGASVMSLHFAPRAEVQWSGWSVLPGGNTSTEVGDAAVVYHDKLYLFGIGKVHHHHFVKTFDGSSWSAWHGLPGSATTRLADAAAVYQDKLYLFGVELTDNTQQVNVFDGSAWSGWSVVPGNFTLGSPDAAVVYGNKLYLFALTPRDSGNRVTLKANSFDGSSWAGWSDVPGSPKTTFADFAATTFNDKLYIFAHDEKGLPSVSTFDGTSWAAWNKVGSDWFDWTEVIDGIQYDVEVEIFDAVTDGNNLFLFTTGWLSQVDSNDPVKPKVYLNVYDGKSWLGWNALPGDAFPLGTSTNAAAVYAGKLYLFGIINGIDNLNVLSV